MRIDVPDPGALLPAARAACGAAPLAFFGGEPLMELVFRGGPGVLNDLRPALPLRLRGT